jgi:hypothetical protein
MLALPLLAAAQGNAGASGVWTLSVTSSAGTETAQAVVAEDNGRLTGIIASSRGQYPVEGTLTADSVTLRFTIRYEGSPLPITLTATPDAGQVSGRADFGGQESGTWTARRASSNGVDGAWAFRAVDGSGSSSAGVMTLLERDGAVSGRLTIRSRGIDGTVKGTRAGNTLKLVLEAMVDGSPVTVDLPGERAGAALKGTFSVADISGSWTATAQ